MTTRTLFLTGVTGFLGKVTLAEAFRRRQELGFDEVGVLIRPRGTHDAAERFRREVAGSPCFRNLSDTWTRTVRVLAGTLSTPGLELRPEDQAWAAERVTHVIHSAASVDFDLPILDAARANITTSMNLLDAAQGWGAMERLVSVSTAYVTPHVGDATPVPETLATLPAPAEELYRQILEGGVTERELLQRAGLPNTYTLTKSIAEHLLIGRRGTVPISILRPSVISASWEHPFPGWIDSTAGFGAFVVLIGLGHLRVVVGTHETQLDLVPVDAVANQLLEATRTSASAPPEIHHVVAGLDRSPRIGECWSGIVDYFRVNRVARQPTFAFLGSRGLRYTLAHLFHHDLAIAAAQFKPGGSKRSGRRLRLRLDHINRVFPYFTSKSFAFETADVLPANFAPGPYVQTVCRGVYQHVLRRDESQWTLAGRAHPGHDGDARWALTQPKGNLWVRGATWMVTKVLRRSMERVTVDLPSFEAAVRSAPPGSPLIIIPNHRSYFDFVLCSYLCFARPDLGIPIPHIAATMEFGKIPLLGRILSALHAFYLRRGLGKEDPDLTRRVHDLLRQGRTLEFFIEGQRSRSREFLTPKRGLLRALQSSGLTCTILPVAMSYDRIPEEAAFAEELAGAPKPKMRLGSLLGWTARVWRGKINLGRAHIACGRPIHLGQESDIHDVSHDVIDALREATVATTYHLECYLQSQPIDGGDVAWLRGAIEARGGKVLSSELQPPAQLDPYIAKTLVQQFAHHFARDGSPDVRLQILHRALYPGDRVSSRVREPVG